MADNQINLPTDPNIAGKLLDSQAQQALKKIDRGLFGMFWGSKDHVPNNVAAAVVVGGIVSIIVILARASDIGSVQAPLGVVSSLVTLAMGYLFGKSGQN